MTHKGRIFEYFIFLLFAMCIGFALSAALAFSTEGAAQPYALQGVYLLALVGAVLVARGLSALRARIRLRHPNAWAWALGGLVFSCGLVARLWVIRKIPIAPASDFETYYSLAKHLADSTLMDDSAALLRIYVAKFPHTIGFPMLLAPAFRLFGASVWVAQCVNLAFSMGSVVLLYAIGRRIGGRSMGLIAMALAAFWPSQILFGTMVATEPSFSFLLLAAFWASQLALARRGKPLVGIALLLLSGVLLGLAGGIRPVAVLMLIAIAVALVAAGPRQKRGEGAPDRIMSLRTMCIVLILLTYVPTGWIINQRVSEEIGAKPASGLRASGYNLMVGTNVEHQGLWNRDDADFFDKAYRETGSAQEAHAASMAVAIKNIRSRPLDVANLMVLKFRDLWQSDDFGIDWNLLWAGQQGILTSEVNDLMNAVRPIGRGMYMILLLLALIGAYRARRSGDSFAYMAVMLLFLATAALHMALETQVRYHYPMLFFLMLSAARACARETQAVACASPAFAPAEPTPVAESHIPAPLDLGEAIRAGHIVVTVSQASARDEEQASA